MAYYFTNRISQQDLHNALIQSLGAQLSDIDLERLQRYRNNWNFYEGYHWENIAETDKPQVTVNYVRAFVNKFIAFEFGNGFTIGMLPEIENIPDENKNPHKLLNYVWDDNDRFEVGLEIGQAKSITGDCWLQVTFEPKYINGKLNPDFKDPFNEYEKGRIRIITVPPSICFPIYEDGYDKDKLKSFNIMYPIREREGGLFNGRKIKTKLYSQEWTEKEVVIRIDKEEIKRIPNKYGVIPFVHFKNFVHQGRNFGISDIDDVIPINTEINLKKSDVSEIIDYHSAPVTVVFGARVGQLERGANKVWGGLPKDARVENLRLEGELSAAQNYIADLKTAMHEVGGIPEGALGSSIAISNTSGVALETILMPLTERVKMKHILDKEALEYTNKLILLIALKEGLIEIPEGVERKDFFYNVVSFDSALPKDGLLELQQIELEMRLGLESREGAMERLGKSNIQENISKIDQDIEKHPLLYGQEDIKKKIELLKAQSEFGARMSNNAQLQNKNVKMVGVNSDGQPKKINSGHLNSPEPKG